MAGSKNVLGSCARTSVFVRCGAADLVCDVCDDNEERRDVEAEDEAVEEEEVKPS
jgi:hypothetical protein